MFRLKIQHLSGKLNYLSFEVGFFSGVFEAKSLLNVIHFAKWASSTENGIKKPVSLNPITSSNQIRVSRK